jgi:hypothetical protein
LFKVGFLTADHAFLNPADALDTTGLKEGDHLTAIATKANIAPTTYAFTCFFPDSEAIGVLISNLD